MAGSNDRYTYAPGALLPGTPYKIERRLGAGGMGVVYVVRHTFLNRLEALKTIHPELVDRRDIAERMQKEAEIVGNLRHPNIVQVTGGGIIQDEWRLPYFAMEMLRGKNLREVLKKKTLTDIASICSVATDVLSALAEAHAHRIVHRDVKPENIFLQLDSTRSAGPKITPKLLDFGIVAVIGGRQTLGFRGTYKYAAPEQLRGEKVSPQTDIYAMGLVIFEMIAGRGPFDEERDMRAIAKAQLEREAPRLSSLVPVPPAVDQLLARALAKDPAKRPATAMAFAQELFILKQVSENHPIALASRTEETLLTTVAEHTAEQRDAQGTPIDKTKREAGLRAPAEVVREEEDKTVEGPLPFGMLAQGGTLENAESLSVSKPSGGSYVPLAFEKTDIDRRMVTRTAEPIPFGVPRHGTEPIPPPTSAPPDSTRRYVDLEAFLADESESASPSHMARSNPSRRDSTPPPVSRLRSRSGTSEAPLAGGAPKRRVGRWLVASAATIIGGLLVWVLTGAMPKSPSSASSRVATAASAQASSHDPIPQEQPVTPSVSAPVVGPIASVSTTASQPGGVVTAPIARPTRPAPRPFSKPNPLPTPTADSPAAPLATASPSPARAPTDVSELQRTITH